MLVLLKYIETIHYIYIFFEFILLVIYLFMILEGTDDYKYFNYNKIQHIIWSLTILETKLRNISVFVSCGSLILVILRSLLYLVFKIRFKFSYTFHMFKKIQLFQKCLIQNGSLDF